MRIKILVLNVKDGDAIIVHLTKEEKNFILLIDGGHVGDADMIIKELNVFLSLANKKGPDLIICTHYDSDHIGGLKSIVNYYKKNIAEILIHRTSQILTIPQNFKYFDNKDSSIFPSESDLVMGADDYFSDIRKEEGVNIVLESIKQEIELLNLIDNLGILSQEPIAGTYKNATWPELEILGPTIDYYKELFPKRFDAKEYLIKEAVVLTAEINPITEEMEPSCVLLESLPKASVTSPNMNSAILKILVNGNAFLFTGDAGIASFENIPNFEETIKNLFWLKVPHHGSRNNINCRLIKLMSPQFAVISGNKHIDESVVSCLRKHCSKVEITRDNNNHLSYTF